MTKALSAIVVDDDHDMVEVLSELLMIKGVNVVAKGYNGNDAITAYRILRPDVVFLDLMMDDYDGFFALENIRKIDPNAKVIVMTADENYDTKQKLKKMNPTSIFYKPLEIDRVMNLLGTFKDFDT